MTKEIIETPNEVLSIHSFYDSCEGTIKLWYTLQYFQK